MGGYVPQSSSKIELPRAAPLRDRLNELVGQITVCHEVVASMERAWESGRGPEPGPELNKEVRPTLGVGPALDEIAKGVESLRMRLGIIRDRL